MTQSNYRKRSNGNVEIRRISSGPSALEGVAASINPKLVKTESAVRKSLTRPGSFLESFDGAQIDYSQFDENDETYDWVESLSELAPAHSQSI